MSRCTLLTLCRLSCWLNAGLTVGTLIGYLRTSRPQSLAVFVLLLACTIFLVTLRRRLAGGGAA